jgi:recombination protein RecR
MLILWSAREFTKDYISYSAELFLFSMRSRELKTLIEKKMREKSLTEIVLALSATPDGDHTADVVRNALTALVEDTPVYVLGRGLSTGTELEYADQETLRNAFLGRK